MRKQKHRNSFSSASAHNPESNLIVCFNKMREKYGEDTGYLTARETLECMPVMTINKQPTTYDYRSFASQFRREKGLTTQISTNKRKHLEKDDGNVDYEDYYATA